MKTLFIILDGLGDRSFVEFGNKTPLQAAFTPNLDRLAGLGMNGLMYPLSPGSAPATEMAHFVLFGYSLADFPGRGVFETIGEGLDLDPKDVVLRASFASVKEDGKNLIVVDRVIGTEEKILIELAAEIRPRDFQGVRFEFVYNNNRQGILFLKGDVSKEITDSDPFANDKAIPRIQPYDETKMYGQARVTADALNQFLRSVYHDLDSHQINDARRKAGQNPINFLVTKWGGQRRKLPSFYEVNGLKGAMVSSGVLLRGLAAEIGLDHLEAPHADDLTEEFGGSLRMGMDALGSGYDFVHVHTKAPDQAAHTKVPLAKAEAIERLDKACAGLAEIAGDSDDLLIVITSDHSTPSSGELIHSGEPVPVLFAGNSVRRDDVAAFNEIACAGGGLGQISGSDLMRLTLNFCDRARYSGSRLTSKETPYYPLDVELLEK